MKKIKTLFLLITLLASFSFGDVWTGDASEPESTQTIDGKKFYVITTPEELAWIAKQVNAGNNSINAVLANDIVFGKDTASVNTEYAWTPIGNDTKHAFGGILDGAGYSIYGVWTDSTIKYAGLVGVLDSSGVVRNLKMKRDSINAYNHAGGIVGNNRGTVSGCTNEGTVTAGDSYAGGIVGCNDDGMVSGCTNEGSVTSGDFYAGGIVGGNRGKVSGCTNEGSVTTACVSEDSYAGGIVGYNRGTVSGCTNEGTVSSDRVAGGVVGYNDRGTVCGCMNEGGVTATGRSNNPYAGGVVGYNDRGTVSDCANSGSVTASYPCKIEYHSCHSYVGGIIGYNRGASTRVKNSYSRTDSLAFMGDAESNKYADVYRGGVVGVNVDTAKIFNCYYDSDELPGVSAIGSNSATAMDVSGMTTAEMQSDQFVLILNTTNGSEKNSGLWSRDGGYPILVKAAKPGGSTCRCKIGRFGCRTPAWAKASPCSMCRGMSSATGS